MPYVKPNDREFDTVVNEVVYDYLIDTGYDVGKLNFFFTRILDCLLQERGVSYTNINEIIGVLECVKMELYRRIAAPYEDKKKEENGDVYECLDS